MFQAFQTFFQSSPSSGCNNPQYATCKGPLASSLTASVLSPPRDSLSPRMSVIALLMSASVTILDISSTVRGLTRTRWIAPSANTMDVNGARQIGHTLLSFDQRLIQLSECNVCPQKLIVAMLSALDASRQIQHSFSSAPDGTEVLTRTLSSLQNVVAVVQGPNLELRCKISSIAASW